MPYLSADELSQIGFKYLGKSVKISTRASIYNVDEIEIGDYSRVDDFCLLSGKITIGKHVHITPYCNLAGGEKGIYIDDFSTLAYGVNIFTQSDDYLGYAMTNSTVPKKYKKEKKEAVYIQKHVIIGAGSYVLPGVTLAEGTSIGAMSLVLKSTEPWKLYVGIPARVLHERKKDLLELEKKYLEELQLYEPE
jgi:acetyltransferase-like isoleucine patch superfamily enzyme